MQRQVREMSGNACILVVDDDEEIRELISEFLKKHGFHVVTAKDGAQMDLRIAEGRPDLVLLDLMLPGEDGLSICRRVSSSGGPPIIMLSAIGEETDRIVGLEIGADDYVAKPCSPRELLARIRAVLRRRSEVVSGASAGSHIFRFETWRFDLVRRELRSIDGFTVPLSTGEFHLLKAFVEKPQRVLTRDQLLNLSRSEEAEAYDRSVDVQISRLRKKLNRGSGGELIQTIRNEGYLFAAKVVRS